MATQSWLFHGWHDDAWVDPGGRDQAAGTWDFDSPAGRVIASMRAGNYIEPSAEFAGISAAVVHKWLRRAKAVLPKAVEWHRKQVPEDDRPFVDFRQAMIQAEAAWEVEAVGRWTRAGNEHWQAVRDQLSRRSPRWAERIRHEHSGPEGGPIAVASIEMTKLIAENPEARGLATQLLAKLAGSVPPSNVPDEADDQDDGDEGEGD